MTKAAFLAFVLALALFAFLPPSRAQPISYGHTLGGPGWEAGFAIDVDGAGNVYVLGQTYPANGTANNLVVGKFDPAGVLIWQRTVTFSLAVYLTDLVVDAAGNSYIDGAIYTNVTGEQAGFLLRLTANGSLGFAEQFPMFPNGLVWNPVTASVVVTGDGVGGYGNGFVASFSASGSLQWMRSVDVNISASAWGAAVNGAGDIYVTLDRPLLSQAALAEFSGNGTLMAQRRLSQPGSPADTWDVGVSPTGDVFFVGFEYARYLPIVADFNATLSPQRSDYVNDSMIAQQLTRVAAHPDGGFFAVGSYYNYSDGAQGTALLHVAANGTLVSDDTYESSSPTGSFSLVDAHAATDGSVLLAGSSTGAPSRDEQSEGAVRLSPTPGSWIVDNVTWSTNTTSTSPLDTGSFDPGYPVDDFSSAASSQVWWGAVEAPEPTLSVGLTAHLPPPGSLNRTVNFTSAVSGGAAPYTYRWSFGDGNSSSAANPAHMYAVGGPYPVQLWVNDSLGHVGYNYTLVSMTAAPVISYFSASPNITYTNNYVAFDAYATDPNGGFITNYHWDFGDNNTADTGYGSTYHFYSRPGNYVATLTVTESEGLSASATALVQVHDAPPYACAWIQPNPAFVGTNVSLASCSWDPDGYITNWSWNFGDGGWSNTSSANATYVVHTYAQPGTYWVTLTVTDNANLSSVTNQSESVIVNVPPTANFLFQVYGYGNQTPSVPGPNQTILFDGSSSAAHNAGSYLVQWAWDFGDGTYSYGYPWAYHAYSLGGRTYAVSLTVYDSYGSVGRTTKNLYVDMPPTAAITTAAGYAKVGTPFLFNGSGSSDSDGTVHRWEWDFGDGGTGSGSLASHMYAATGMYTVTLQVFDNNNLAGAAQTTISVVEPKSPTAVLGYSPSRPVVGDAVAFNATQSIDPDGAITTYTWEFGDGGIGSGVHATHVYAAPGTYTVILTVLDEDAITASATTTIQVVSRPVAAFVVSPSAAQVGDALTFSAQGSSDLSGQLTYTWSFGDGSYGTGWQTTHAYAESGTFEVTLTVTNPYGMNATSTHSVVIAAGFGLTPSVASGLAWLAVGLAAGAAVVGLVFYLIDRRRKGGSAPPPPG